MHPTAEKLIDTVSEMLDGEHPHAILVDDVLSASGVSRGALYHHFGITAEAAVKAALTP